jgi:iron complex transport system substrate-binding protein
VASFAQIVHEGTVLSPLSVFIRFIRFIRVLCLCGSSVAVAGISSVDDLGRNVELKAPAQRIVTLAPFLTELAYSAGAGARLVGVSAYSDYPEEAKALPRVGSAMGPEIEPVAALRPDLVLAWQDSIRREDIERLERLGAAVFVARAQRLDDIPRLLEAVGRLTGQEVAGAAAGYRGRLAQLRATYAGRTRVRVFVEIWHAPLTTIAGRHWINEALELCAADNVFGELTAVAPVVSVEELYRRDPRAIVGAGSNMREAQFRAGWRDHATLEAVRSGRLVYVDADTLQRPTLRLAEGVARLCEGLERVRPS